MPAGPGVEGGSREAAGRERGAIRKSFDDGVALTNAGKNEEAIAKFNEVDSGGAQMRRVLREHRHGLRPHEGLREGRGRVQAGDRVKPDFAEAYNGLANVYNAEKKFDLAAEASAQAMKLSGAGAGAARRAAAPPPLQHSTRE